MEIVRSMEQLCPQAWFINYTNPMVRICDAIARYSRIKVVGLCHQIYACYGMVGYVLADLYGIQVPEGEISTHADPDLWPRLGQLAHQAVQHVTIQAAGLNHFTWMLDLRDRRTGQDLYPLFTERWERFDPNFEPLTRRVYAAFGLFPVPGDEHLCEYLPWLSDPLTRPWEKYTVSLYDWERMSKLRDHGHDDIARMGRGELSIDALRHADSEGALEMITNVAGAGSHYHVAVNLPNDGYIRNLPQGAIVEVPGHVSGLGVRGIGVGSLPAGVAELCRHEIAAVQLGVDAAVRGDRQAALQCLLLSPGVSDLDVARQILEDYLETYRVHLPQFWK
jgi:alpha-galactosidase